MPIHFTCPHCQSETMVDDQYAGQTGPCVECGKMIMVPLLRPASATAPDVGQAHAASAAAGRKKSSLLPLIGVLLAAVLAGVLGISMLIVVVFPAVERVRESGLKSRSADNLRQIGMALRMYEATHGCFPPAVVRAADGTPMHSWRVLLLPYLGQEGLHGEYDFTQPWDSPANMQLVPRMPAVFASPSDDGALTFGETRYMAIVGDNCVFREKGCTASREVTDGLGETILVVEATVDGVAWTEPKDLQLKTMNFTINGKGAAVGGCHADGANVLMANERTRFLRNDTPAEYVEGMATKNGGELVPLDEFE